MWSHENIRRLLIDFSLKSSNQSFIGDHRIYQNKNTDFKNDIGLDSIELMQLAAYANNFFNLFSIKDSPYLLSHTKLNEWVELIYDARQRADESLKFNTSGTSGKSNIIEHRLTFLQRELSLLANLFKNSSQIVTYTPSYSIYGFLFTIGLPAYLQIPVIYPSQVNWQNLMQGTLIVATPFNWQLLVNNLPENMNTMKGVTAAAPIHQALFKQISSKNITLTEIYGATETAGVGFRNHWENPFTLFPYWQINEQNGILDLKDKDNNHFYPLMDEIIQFSDQTFSVVRRKDQQIKIAGHLVDLDSIKKTLLKLTNIQDCTLSAKAESNEMIIQANLKLKEDNEASRLAIQKEIRNLLPAQEHPRLIYFNLD